MSKPSLCVWTPRLEQQFGSAAAAVGDVRALLMFWPALFIFFQLQVPFAFVHGVNIVSRASWEGRRNVTTVFYISYIYIYFF